MTHHAYDEEDVMGCLFGSLATVFDKTEIGGVKTRCYNLAAWERHRRGRASMPQQEWRERSCH
jgi:hypothetical protein